MSTLTIFIVILFCIGYFFIAIESVTKINKAAIALLMFVGCWTLFMIDPGSYIATAIGEMKASAVSSVIEHHLGSTSTTLFFLMGAMTIVELVDQNGGFNFVRDTLQTKSKRSLLWRIAFMTFILSAILDNLTTSIVMIMILRKLVSDQKDRLIYAALVVIAANSGGAFSPIGDVTTIMLWNKGVITAAGVIMEIFIPSLVSMMIPAYILSLSLKGDLTFTKEQAQTVAASDLTTSQRKTIFFLGVGGLIFVPIFKTITHLPPFVGILLVLGVLWTVTEMFYANRGISKDAMRAKTADQLDAAFTAAFNAAKTAKDFKNAAEILEMKAEVLGLDKEDAKVLETRVYAKTFRVFSLSASDIGLPTANRRELAEMIDGLPISDMDRKRISMEAGIIDMDIVEVLENESQEAD